MIKIQYTEFSIPKESIVLITCSGLSFRLQVCTKVSSRSSKSVLYLGTKNEEYLLYFNEYNNINEYKAFEYDLIKKTFRFYKIHLFALDEIG